MQQENDKIISRTFWFFTIAIVLGLTLPVLIQDGMFMDGELYAAVSHNMAKGIGSFWFPSFSYNNLAGIHESFHEQPPLVFGIQALFFKVFGDSLYVERGYTFLMLLLNIFLIRKIWNLIHVDNKSLQYYSWFPVLLWILFPVCFWSFSNNMHENTVSVFVLAAVYFQLRPLYIQTEPGKGLLYILTSGLFIFLASFSKGLPGLFPIFTPFILSYFQKKYTLRRALIHFGILIGVLTLIYGIMLCFDDARKSLYNYVFLRLLNRVQHVPTTDHRLETLYRLIQELIIPGILIIGIQLLALSNRIYDKAEIRKGYPMFIIGLSGILPLLLTMVQKGFYMVPALPFIAISLAMSSVIDLEQIISSKLKATQLKFAHIISLILLLSVIAFSITRIGHYSRDEDKLMDIYTMSESVPKGTVFNCPENLLDDWSFQTYSARYFHWSLDNRSGHNYFISDRTNIVSPDSSNNGNIEEIPLPLTTYRLFKKGH